MSSPARDVAVPGEAPRTPTAARRLADYHERSEHEDGARRGRALRKWAQATAAAKRRSSAGMSGEAEDHWERAESHRQALADLGVEVPSRADLETPPPAPPRSPRKSSSSRSSSTRSGSASPRRSRSSSSSALSTVANVTGARAGARAAGGLVGPIFVGTLGLVLLLRLIDTSRGGPKVFAMIAGAVNPVVDRIVLPVDPFKSGSVRAPARSSSTAPAAPTAPITGAPALPSQPHHI